ncbi:MAG TPA: hypothetical protein DCY82_10930 [Acidimicrobiaceae bacterium]|nr:hypothetical protein [Acidimicrobiaceae bacterium]
MKAIWRNMMVPGTVMFTRQLACAATGVVERSRTMDRVKLEQRFGDARAERRTNGVLSAG